MPERPQPVSVGRRTDERSRLASIVISTKGRPDQALKAVQSCLAQDWPDLEVLVFDDEPEQRAARAMRRAVPSRKVRIFTVAESRGYIANRNRGFAEARGDIVFSLDDDAYFTDPESVARTVAVFDDRSIAAVALPYVEPLARRSQSAQQRPFQSKAGAELRSYVGCAHAVRREAVIELGGYREFFVHQAEERELSMRLWANGWRIVCGDSGPVVHNVDPRRDNPRILYYACRNQLLTEILNTPSPDLFLRISWLALGLLRYRFTWATLPTRLGGLAAGIAEGVGRRALRRPMERAAYRRWRALPGHGPADFSGALPSPCEPTTASRSALSGAGALDRSVQAC